MQVILYSTHCPKCMILEKKLKSKNIDYIEVNDIEVMKEKNYLSVPILEVDGERLDFSKAVEWVNKN